MSTLVTAHASHRECLIPLLHSRSIADTWRSRACGPLQDAFEYGNLSTSVGAYDYCTDWAYSDFVTGCVNCLRSSEDQYLANLVSLLQVGCDQKPNPGSTVAVKGGIFSTTLMNETTPSLSGSWSAGNSGPISLGGKVGIAIGGFCFLVAVAGFFIVCNGRRRRRAFLRKLEMRQKESGWPHPGMGGVVHRGPDMNETPLSQKPLRGWDDSPQSATASEPHFQRYFSPYSSPYTSPVSGSDNPGMTAHQWPQEFHQQTMQGYPSSAQEKAMQDQHEAAANSWNPPMHIGVALGGDDKGSHAESTNQGGRDNRHYTTGEEYELHEVSSAGESSAGGHSRSNHSNSFRNRMAREAPTLQHPGPGRYSPDRILPPPAPAHTMRGGLGDEDAQHGNLI